MGCVDKVLALGAHPFNRVDLLLRNSGGSAVIDGGFAVQLEHHGAEVKNPLWTALCLITSPDLVSRVHWDYLEAGAQIVLTSSYQATLLGFESRGYTREQGKEFLRRSVTLACEARDKFWNEYQQRVQKHEAAPGQYCRALVGASIGSYGAYLADGSEYSGDYGPEMTLEKLKDFHRERLLILAGAGPDILALETIPSFLEAKALIEVLEEEDINVPAWMSYISKDGRNVVRGDSIQSCAELVERSEKIVAFGINCTPPSLCEELISEARKITSKPIVVYPNRGEDWNAEKKEWIPSTGATDEDFINYIPRWKKAGANLFGGCCQTTPATVRAIAKVLHPHPVSSN
ncbi:homocysteine S-methyltransferase [Marchantia polymorpha subsp. ruderalis]|uniref:Hcy-binding domain-containing protein n=2 Tax=Marchantia polymorpha TaxID=3197 RepID=A0A176WP99_MARPO|nr:hypothetical protein AXG93_4875s1120 [Marchantia polymorpha subsp. ruderalis]PTQ49464.1 hypothetical protein MARPO_0003s0301 [Marchantia polymorpha]BBN17228.1 hypothetical protein Mp_7g12930 [Marchantia polymorpha subsp. ruderalis]|eukprot:PTQ49464.1 hypothetical protein MARPO_0003s0301 [Marchantia polymorpha]